MSLSRTSSILQYLVAFLPLINPSLSTHSTSVQIPDDAHVVTCTEDKPCAGFVVSDCLETDRPCFIDCSNGDGICKNALFYCHRDHDCTLFCDSWNATDSCHGIILNATLKRDSAVTVQCLNYRSCQHIVVDTSFSINTSLSITVRMDPPSPPILNAEGQLTDIPKYIAKHGTVFLADSGSTSIHCEGHSACHSMAVYGNTTSDALNQQNPLNAFNLTLSISGFHSFKDSYLSIPSYSDIRIWCGIPKFDNSILTNSGVVGGPCNGAMFDGRFSGMHSTLTMECHGDSACSQAVIIGNDNNSTLNVEGDGDRVMAESQIYCPSNGEICTLSVIGNGSAMMDLMEIHALNGLNDVVMHCNYGHSVLGNCYEAESTAPILLCSGYGYGVNDTDQGECTLSLMESTYDEWECLNESISSICGLSLDHMDRWDEIPTEDINYMISTTMMVEDSVEDEGDGVFEDVEVATKAVLNLWTNPKGQVALASIVGVLLMLCVAVCWLKNEEIKGICGSELNEEKGGSGIFGMEHNGLGFRYKVGSSKRAKYASVEEEDSVSVLQEVHEIGMDSTESDNTFDDSFDSDEIVD